MSGLGVFVGVGVLLGSCTVVAGLAGTGGENVGVPATSGTGVRMFGGSKSNE